jgi:thymidylate kinase
MLIEFLGVPGSGKSTVSHVFADMLRNHRFIVAEVTYDLDKQHRKVARLLLKSTQLLSFALKWPHKTYSYCCCIASTGQNSLVDFAKALFNWIFIASVAHRQRASVITVLDQGVAQALWSVGYAARKEIWTNLLPLEPSCAAILPDLVVHVRASPQSLKERLAARAQRVSRLESLGGDCASLVRARANSDAIVQVLKTRGVQVIEIDNDYPDQLATGARSILDALTLLLKDGSRTISPPVTFGRI